MRTCPIRWRLRTALEVQAHGRISSEHLLWSLGHIHLNSACEPLTGVFARRYTFFMWMRVQSNGMLRAAIAVAAIYALLFNALLSASAPLAASPLASVSICGHDGAAPDQPGSPDSAHHELCCIAGCGMTAAAALPADHPHIVTWSSKKGAAVQWSVTALKPLPPAQSQTSPRGPPILI
jgi:hypothetical protein